MDSAQGDFRPLGRAKRRGLPPTKPIHAAYRGSTASIALITSGASGGVRGRNR